MTGMQQLSIAVRTDGEYCSRAGICSEQGILVHLWVRMHVTPVTTVACVKVCARVHT